MSILAKLVAKRPKTNTHSGGGDFSGPQHPQSSTAPTTDPLQKSTISQIVVRYTQMTHDQHLTIDQGRKNGIALYHTLRQMHTFLLAVQPTPQQLPSSFTCYTESLRLVSSPLKLEYVSFVGHLFPSFEVLCIWRNN